MSARARRRGARWWDVPQNCIRCGAAMLAGIAGANCTNDPRHVPWTPPVSPPPPPLEWVSPASLLLDLRPTGWQSTVAVGPYR